VKLPQEAMRILARLIERHHPDPERLAAASFARSSRPDQSLEHEGRVRQKAAEILRGWGCEKLADGVERLRARP
jgi:hypothetical protein